VGLLSACDITVGVQASKFVLSEVKLGLIPATISPYVIARMGSRYARRYFLTAERFDAATAKSVGLLHEVVDAGAGLDEWESRISASVLENGPKAVAAAKQLIEAVENRPINAALLQDTARRLSEQRMSEEGKDGVSSFISRRRPAWAPPAPTKQPKAPKA
jgi:methylglutaconyl-CoA hydratase